MLFARDNGQMCNNILLYGHAYAWAKEYGRSIVPMRFAYKYKYFKLSKALSSNLLVYLYAKLMVFLRLIPEFDFPCDIPFSELDKTLKEHKTAVIGGWGLRYYDLFLKYRKDIVEMFAFLPRVERTTERYIQRAESRATNPLRIGIHVRRGDYKRHLGGIYYYDDEVYISKAKEAIAIMQSDAEATGQQRDVCLYICGNDPTLNKLAYQQAFPGITVSFPNGNAGEDLCLLSKMDCLVGPPSTFSLVAAMYRDLPLYFIRKATAPVAFHRFADYFYYDDCRKAAAY